jgi:hypothetical protein
VFGVVQGKLAALGASRPWTPPNTRGQRAGRWAPGHLCFRWKRDLCRPVATSRRLSAIPWGARGSAGCRYAPPVSWSSRTGGLSGKALWRSTLSWIVQRGAPHQRPAGPRRADPGKSLGARGRRA